MPSQLISQFFLEDGIIHTSAWQGSLSQPADLDSFRTRALTLLEKADNLHTINEASTEMELIRPLFDLLGWNHYLPQQGSDHDQDIPERLLFGDAKSKDYAVNKPAAARYSDALAVVESKHFGLPHDGREGRQTGSPHGQIFRYLATADINFDGHIRWSILTSGHICRSRSFWLAGGGPAGGGGAACRRRSRRWRALHVDSGCRWIR